MTYNTLIKSEKSLELFIVSDKLKLKITGKLFTILDNVYSLSKFRSFSVTITHFHQKCSHENCLSLLNQITHIIIHEPYAYLTHTGSVNYIPLKITLPFIIKRNAIILLINPNCYKYNFHWIFYYFFIILSFLFTQIWLNIFVVYVMFGCHINEYWTVLQNLQNIMKLS